MHTLNYASLVSVGDIRDLSVRIHYTQAKIVTVTSHQRDIQSVKDVPGVQLPSAISNMTSKNNNSDLKHSGKYMHHRLQHYEMALVYTSCLCFQHTAIIP
jgi:hypothetical protein